MRQTILNHRRPGTGLNPTVAVTAMTRRIQLGEPSGKDAETTSRCDGPFSPEMRAAFIVSPEVVYSPIVPGTPDSGSPKCKTNKLSPDTAMSSGLARPVT